MSADKVEQIRQAARQQGRKHHDALANTAKAGGDLSQHGVPFLDEVRAYLSTVPEDERKLYWEFLVTQLNENAVAQHHQATEKERAAVALVNRRAKRFMILLCGVIAALALTAALQMT